MREGVIIAEVLGEMGESATMDGMSVFRLIPSFLCLWALLGLGGCIRPALPLAMGSLDPAQDHWKIAALYLQEAVALRQRAEEQNNRTATYEVIFGPDSEWSTGSRILAQSYENWARDRERQATLHLELANKRSPRGSGASEMRQ